MTKPLRHPLLPVGPGHRSAETLLRLDERDRYLREAASRFCIGMSDRAAAAVLFTKLARYREGAWRRDASEALCPVRHRGTVTQFLWMVLKCRDAVPGERLIRLVLARG